jgi:hypothetical protein
MPKPSTPRQTGPSSPQHKPIEQYEHRDKERLNNPPAGLVSAQTDRLNGRQTYAYDPHLDPQLQWAGKAEHMSFQVPTVSLHVHERIDPLSIIEAVRKRQQDTSEARAKRGFLDEWVCAVNAQGGFGRWRAAVSYNPADSRGILAGALGVDQR